MRVSHTIKIKEPLLAPILKRLGILKPWKSAQWEIIRHYDSGPRVIEKGYARSVVDAQEMAEKALAQWESEL